MAARLFSCHLPSLLHFSLGQNGFMCLCCFYFSPLLFSGKILLPVFPVTAQCEALCPRRAHYCLQNSIPDSNRAWLLPMTTITLKTASWCLRGLQHLAWPLVKGLMKGTDK